MARKSPEREVERDFHASDERVENIGETVMHQHGHGHTMAQHFPHIPHSTGKFCKR